MAVDIDLEQLKQFREIFLQVQCMSSLLQRWPHPLRNAPRPPPPPPSRQPSCTLRRSRRGRTKQRTLHLMCLVTWSCTPYRFLNDHRGIACQQADGGELDADGFNQKLGPTFGAGLSDAALAQLFMKIDADCGGTVSWSVLRLLRQPVLTEAFSVVSVVRWTMTCCVCCGLMLMHNSGSDCKLA